jgi:hypothetical protein
MRANRIKRGFHRIGVVIAVPCLVIAVIALAMGFYNWLQVSSNFYVNIRIGIQWLAGGITWYVVAWAVGWIIAGFANDD